MFFLALLVCMPFALCGSLNSADNDCFINYLKHYLETRGYSRILCKENSVCGIRTLSKKLMFRDRPIRWNGEESLLLRRTKPDSQDLHICCCLVHEYRFINGSESLDVDGQINNSLIDNLVERLEYQIVNQDN